MGSIPEELPQGLEEIPRNTLKRVYKMCSFVYKEMGGENERMAKKGT